MSAKATRIFIIGTFVTLYLLVSVISTIHVVDFFLMSNPKWLAISLAVAFEVGAAASLAAIITLEKMNKGMVWGLFILLTLMQAMGNTYYTYIHLNNFSGWIELFGLVDEELIYQKRILSIVSGAILPIVALGFIKSLVDYLRPEPEVKLNLSINEPVEITNPEQVQEPIETQVIDNEPYIAEEKIDQPSFEIPEPEKEVYDIEIDARDQPSEQVEETLSPPIIKKNKESLSIKSQDLEKKEEPLIAGSDPDPFSLPVNDLKKSDKDEVDNTKVSLNIDERLSRGKRIEFNDSI